LSVEAIQPVIVVDRWHLENSAPDVHGMSLPTGVGRSVLKSRKLIEEDGSTVVMS
jgi:hypothetical protein